VRLNEEDWEKTNLPATRFARAASRATSDKANCLTRAEAPKEFLGVQFEAGCTENPH